MRGILKFGFANQVLSLEDAESTHIRLDSFNLEKWEEGDEVEIIATVESDGHLGGGYYIVHNQEKEMATQIAIALVDIIEEDE